MAAHRLLVLIAMPTALACTEDVPVDVVRSDRTGVTVVESDAPAWTPDEAWSVREEPMLDLTETGVGSAHEFYRVEDATRLADGTIVVANRGSFEVRVYSADGTHVGSVGREGEGPGEFQRVSMVHALPGDSILAFDYWLGRLTVISADLRLVRVAGRRGDPGVLREVHPLPDGSLLGMYRQLGDMDEVLGLMRVPDVLLTLTRELETRDTITTIPGLEAFVFDQGDSRPLLGKRSFVGVQAGRVVAGTADGLAYQVYDLSGVLVEVVRAPTFDLTVTAAVLAEEREDRMLMVDDPPQWYVDVERSLPDPPMRPGYSDLIVDALGNVWLCWYPTIAESDDALEWQVFGPTGRWLGGVMLPPRFRVFEIGADYVLGRRLDELDVEHVQVLELRRGT